MKFDSQITFCYTRDLAGTARFYEEKLGLRLVLDQAHCRIYAVAGGAYLGFCQGEDCAAPGDVVLTLVTENVDGWYEELKSKDVAFDTSPAFNPEYNIYHCFLRDPNGYRLEIQRFEDPRWRRS